MLLRDDEYVAVWINCFGGGMRKCDVFMGWTRIPSNLVTRTLMPTSGLALGIATDFMRCVCLG